MEKDGAGRPPKYNTQLCNKIVASVRKGVPYDMAAYGHGIVPSTFYKWLNEGFADIENGIDSPLAKFSESVKQVEMDKLEGYLAEVEEKPERWQAIAWLIERRWYKYFGSNAQLNELQQRLDKLEELERQGKKDATQ